MHIVVIYDTSCIVISLLQSSYMFDIEKMIAFSTDNIYDNNNVDVIVILMIDKQILLIFLGNT